MLTPQLINWLLLGFLVITWGTSFMVTSIALQGGLSALAITIARIGLGAIVIVLFAYSRGLRLPRDAKSWGSFMLLGLFGSALPFILITWGQRSVTSASTGVLMSVMPFVTMLIAHYFVAGEQLNRYKLLGFLVAFSCVTILLNPFGAGSIDLLGALAILAAASCYAINTVLIRLLPTFNPLIGGAGMMICASVLVLPFVIYNGQSIIHEILLLATPSAIFSLLWLGLMPAGIASIVYFIVVNRAGPSFLSNCNFLIPVVAYFAGTLILGDTVPPSSLFALIGILTGIVLTRIQR
ncbi:DMT family transporter [Amphritea sp. 2_MG-2023]|uniref:DMT family transporter n=1 Tax=Amphritea TaxID=515417 RepID=UPI0026E2BD1D|nr:DMT family transporter [Amphritea sp. 2_MG-2023]MDO6417515.1 DMT family transporter [Amphritea sp. 2_MG-2023]MDX2421850.1 DMT family transporter [Amphritea sp.]